MRSTSSSCSASSAVPSVGTGTDSSAVGFDLQLRQRQQFPTAQWQDVTSDLDLVQFVCQLLVETSRWSNHHFVPADRMTILTCLDDGRFFRELAGWLGRPIGEDDERTMLAMNLGELVQYLEEAMLHRVDGTSGRDGEPHAAFA